MDASNLSEAPILTVKDKMIQEIKEKTKKVLNKYFQGRDYEKENVNFWKDYAMEELTDFLKPNYKDYGFGLFIIMIKKGDIRTNSNKISRSDTDFDVLEYLETKTMYVEIRVNLYKIYKIQTNYLNSCNEKLVMEMNNMLNLKLEGKQYSYDFAKGKVEEIVNELEEYLLTPNPRPCSYHICSILSKPCIYQFDYKIVNLKYIPIISCYSNDSLYCLLILFILDN